LSGSASISKCSPACRCSRSGWPWTPCNLAGALETTRSLVIVGAPTIDGGSRASKTLDWLAAHGFDELVADAVVVLSCDRPQPP
jgi:MinD-like ATPase involved in chromosome partitioning or flagellar assembly